MSEARSRHFRGLALMGASAASFAANALLIRGLGHLFNVWLLAGVRFAVGLAVLGLVFRRQFQPSHLLTNRKLIERGLVGGLGVWTYYEAIVHVGAGRSTFINGTYIFWAALMAAWVFRERLRPITIGGAVAALAGIALLTDVFARGGGPSPYDGFALLSALGSAYVAIAIRQLHSTEHTATIFGAQCAYGLGFCLICGSVRASLGPPGSFHAPAAGWGLALVSGVCVAAGQLAQTRAYRDLPVAEGSLVQMLSPLGTAIGGAVFYGERLSLPELVGAALILGGSACAAVRRPGA
ncbi:MAG TPA: DMT family transporter [Opitutaceae bacterium]|jgi:drug/metabolite transporter (DMT)-like permease|nr:DMT family transporter [Opitutaceae bacterium]